MFTYAFTDSGVCVYVCGGLFAFSVQCRWDLTLRATTVAKIVLHSRKIIVFTGVLSPRLLLITAIVREVGAFFAGAAFWAAVVLLLDRERFPGVALTVCSVKQSKRVINIAH